MQTEFVRVDDIERDHRVNTRPVDQQWVEKHVPKFNPDALGTLTVSRRVVADPSGLTRYQLIVLDGQNRQALVFRVREATGNAPEQVLCRVYEGLTLAQEARLFGQLNDSRHVKRIHRFLADITAEDPAALGIQAIVRDHGWKISDQSTGESITAVASLQAIYREGRDPGPMALDATLQTVTEAWGYKQEAVNGQLLVGLARVYARWGDEIDRVDMIKKLAQYPGGPSGLLGNARGKRLIDGITITAAVSDIVQNTYNRYKRLRSLQ